MTIGVDLSHVPNSFDPVAKHFQYALTVDQANAAKAAALARGLDVEEICEEEFYCRLDELTKRAADMLIKYINQLTPKDLKKLGGHAPNKQVKTKAVAPTGPCCPHVGVPPIGGTMQCMVCLCGRHGGV